MQQEVYTRLHLGVVNENIDFFSGRICFKGHSQYNVNLFQEFEMKNVADMAEEFDKNIQGIISGLVVGVDMFRVIIAGPPTVRELAAEMSAALEDLPSKVWELRYQASNTLTILGQIDEAEFTPIFHPLQNLIKKITSLLNDVKTDVTNFYNRLLEPVTVVIPYNTRMIYQGVSEVIDGIKFFVTDPKSSMAKINKGVMEISVAVKALTDSRTKIQEASLILKDSKPYWWDLDTEYEIYEAFAANITAAVTENGQTWVEPGYLENEDPVALFTQNATTEKELKQEILDNLTSIDIPGMLEPLINMADTFVNKSYDMFVWIKKVKEAEAVLKERCEAGQSVIDTIFGAKVHADFPRRYRLADDTCKGSGFYPSQLTADGSTEYWSPGVDLVCLPDSVVVAPFAGLLMLGNSSNEIVIQTDEGSIRDTTIIITNVKPNGTILHPSDNLYIEKRVAAGVPIGLAVASPCNSSNHIHVAMKREGGFIDPTRFLQTRMFEMPQWVQICDDFKLEYKGETIAAGTIVGVAGQKQLDTSPTLTNGIISQPDDLDIADDPMLDIQEYKSKFNRKE
ncbi:unnamed protein product [Mytilus edulis]|uniref:Uncharacterized protein n=1 Tax=Mytilus edulis TaxID=6550 RepID=A0A8S3S6J5_MYTED|nr:unnamed protein product [Mytilus edulis]